MHNLKKNHFMRVLRSLHDKFVLVYKPEASVETYRDACDRCLSRLKNRPA